MFAGMEDRQHLPNAAIAALINSELLRGGIRKINSQRLFKTHTISTTFQ
jgi:hypothetical protein